MLDIEKIIEINYESIKQEAERKLKIEKKNVKRLVPLIKYISEEFDDLDIEQVGYTEFCIKNSNHIPPKILQEAILKKFPDIPIHVYAWAEETVCLIGDGELCVTFIFEW